MKIVFTILVTITLLCSSNINEQIIFEKLIISSGDTASSLKAIKKYCNENTTIHALQEQHHFQIKMERLGDYNVTVITPLESISVRNTLFIILSPIFKDVFYVKEVQKEESTSRQEGTVLWVYYGIGLQWIALLLLSFIGLFLSLKSRKKITELIESQNELLLEQQKMEKEIKSLGGDSA